MLRAGSEEHWGYSPGRLFSDLPPREWMQGWESHPPSPAYETCQSTGSPCLRVTSLSKVPNEKECSWHGGWVTHPHLQDLESCALLVCHRRLLESSFGHERAQRRLSNLGSHPGIDLLRRALCALSWQIVGWICHKRTNTAATHGTGLFTQSLASHPQVFHGGCFGVYGTPPGEAVS